MEFEPLMTTNTGSFPRPLWLATTDGSTATVRHQGAALREAEEDATRLVIQEQEAIGLDIVTDGEMRRENFIYQALASWDGVDLANKRTKQVYRNRNAPRAVPRIVGKIVRRRPAAVEDVQFAKTLTPRPLKIAVVGPMTVVDSTSNEFYKDEAELAMDAAIALNAELLDLQAAGADMLQLDEPAMTRHHDKLTAYGAKALDRRLEGVHVPTFVHLCYGYPLGQEPNSFHLSAGVRGADEDAHLGLQRRVPAQPLRSRGAGDGARSSRHVRLRRSGRIAAAGAR